MDRIRSRHDLPGQEKCPHCLQIFVNFADLGNSLLGCLKCGCVFIEKDKREYLREHQKTILSDQLANKELVELGAKVDNGKVVVSLLECECGFIAKSNAGLAAHQRNCTHLMENEHESGSSGN